MLGSERIASLLSHQKKYRAEQAESQQQHEEEHRKKFGFGIDLHAESKKARDNGFADVLIYQRYIWSVANGQEDTSLRPDAVKIVKRLKLSATAINYDLDEAKRYLMIEQRLAASDKAPLTAAREAAKRKLDELDAATKTAIAEFNAAFTKENQHAIDERAYGHIPIDNRRLFGTLEELDSYEPEVRDNYLLGGLPV